MKTTRRRFVKSILVGLFLSGLVLAIWLGLRNRARAHRSERNYSLIEPRLYMGGSVRHPPPESSAVLNLCEVQDPYECEVHVWDRIPDSAPAPSLDWLRKQVDFVDAQYSAGRTVYVHCYGGVSRAGMVVAAYLMSKHGWTRDQALDFARSKRPIVKPNPAFMELLLEWERTLKT